MEHEVAVQARPVRERAVLHGFLPALRDVLLEFLRERRMALLGPFAERDQVILQSHHGISERPLLVVVLRSISGWIVARGMGRAAIRDVLDQRGARTGTCTLRRPLGHGMD